MSCIYCSNTITDTFVVANWRVCPDCETKPHRERIKSRLSMWQREYPPGSDFTGEGHAAPPAWVYDFWRQCDFTDEQLAKVEPSLGSHTLSMDWHTFDGQLVSKVERHKNDADENAHYPRRWDYLLEFGDEDEPTDRPCVYFWRSNTIGIPLRHWEPREGGAYMHGVVAGEWVDHPQPSWAVLEGFLLTEPAFEQIHHFVNTGEMPVAQHGQCCLT